MPEEKKQRLKEKKPILTIHKAFIIIIIIIIIIKTLSYLLKINH